MSTIMIGAAALIAVTIVPGVLLRVSSVARMRRLCRGRLLLTYDDGPSPSPTDRILAVLRRHGARGTFFMLGHRATQSASMCDRIVAEGHEVGAHGFVHLHAWKSPVSAVADVVRGLRAVAPWRTTLSLHRPPFGISTLWTVLAATASGARTVWWTIDSRDSWKAPPNPEAVVAKVEREQGGVVLMHDFEREAGMPDVQYTLDLTERLLRLAALRGWSVCTASEVLAAGALRTVPAPPRTAAR